MNAFFLQRQCCPACESRQLREIYRRDYDAEVMQQYLHDFYSRQGACHLSRLEGASFILARCEQCTCVFQQEIPNEQLLFELYEVWLDPSKTFGLYATSYGLDYYLAYLTDIYRYLRLFQRTPKQLKFFDFGMGWGNWLVAARAYGVNVFGSELSPKRTAHAAAVGITNLNYDEIPNYNFDFINIDQVFEHVPDPLAILKHLTSALSPGGFLRIAVPNGNNIGALLKIDDWKAAKGSRHSLNALAPLEHINCFSTQALLALAAKAGLQKVALPDYPKLKEVETPRPLRDSVGKLKRTGKSALKPLLGPVYRKLKGRGPDLDSGPGTDLLFQLS